MSRTLAAALLGLLVGATAHAAVPERLTVEGQIAAPGGAPYEGDVLMVFTLFDGPGVGAAAVWTETSTVPVAGGHFVTQLGDVVPLTASVLADLPGATLQLAIDPDGVVGRVPVASLPFAFQVARADGSDTLEGWTADAFARSAQACAAGQAMTGVDAAGLPVCAADADHTYSGADFVVAAQSCGAGQVSRGVDASGALLCVADADTTYTGADFATSGQACAVGQLARAVDASGALVCVADADTTYTGANFATSGQACAGGQLVRGVDAGGALVCVADQDTTYSGANFALSGQGCPAGQVVRAVTSAGALTCVPDVDTNTTYSGADFALSSQTCGTNKVAIGVSTTGTLTCQDVSTWDRDASNDLTTTTTFAGDVTGTYSALTIPAGKVTASKLDRAYLPRSGGTVNGTVVGTCLRPWRTGYLAFGSCGALPTGYTQPTAQSDGISIAPASNPAVGDDETLFFTTHDDCDATERVFMGTGATGNSATAWRGLEVRGSGTAVVSGTLTANAGQLYPSDLAENLPIAERLEAGDVVVAEHIDLDDFAKSRFRRAARAYDPTVVGVVSDTVALGMGPQKDRQPVALKGIVKVKVDARTRPIAKGDLLVASDTPGRAMAAAELVRGTVIGKALEDLDGDLGVILMLVMPR
ncbi:MAG: hypothetical protein EP329_23910 [Deltaproteobacteria bacterium]|nr:MAG: hypothetical protein EP329_23910 [Deltaproteobacteria bacterium]